MDRGDPFLKEMRDEQRQLRVSSGRIVPNIRAIPPIPAIRVQPGVMVKPMPSPMPSIELDQLHSRLEAIRPDLDILHLNMKPFREHFEAFRDNFELHLQMEQLDVLRVDDIKIRSMT